MAFVLVIIGAALLTASVKNSQGQLFGLLKGDLTGLNNFVYWIVSILIIGSIGYIPKLRGLSTMFLALVVIVLVLKRGDPNAASGGLFQKLMAQLATTQNSTSSSVVSFPQLNNAPVPAGDTSVLSFSQLAG